MKRLVLIFAAIAAATCTGTAIHGSAMAQSSVNYCELEKVRELGTFDTTGFSRDSKRLFVAGGNDAKLGLVISTSTGADVARLEHVSFISHLGSDEDWTVYSNALSGRKYDALSGKVTRSFDGYIAISTRLGIKTSARKIHNSSGYLIFERPTGIEVLRKSDATKRFLPIAGEYSSFTGYDRELIAIHVNGSSVITVRDLANTHSSIDLDLGMTVATFEETGSNIRFSSAQNSDRLFLAVSIVNRDLYRTVLFDVHSRSRIVTLDGYFFPNFVKGGRYLIAKQGGSWDDPKRKYAIVDLTNASSVRYIDTNKDAELWITDISNSVSSGDKLIDLVTLKERPFVKDDAYFSDLLDGGKFLYQRRDGIYIDTKSKQVACKAIRSDGRDYEWGFSASPNGQFLTVRSKPASDSNAKHSIDLYRLLDKSAIESRIVDLREHAKKIPPASKSSAQKMFFSAFELFQGGEFRAAHKAFSQALELDPTNPQGHFLMGETLSRLNDRNTARLHYRYAVAFGAGSKESFIAEDRLASFK